MKALAALVDALTYMTAQGDRNRLLGRYFASTPDPERGWALAALTGELPGVSRATLRRLAEGRVDPELFRISRDYVGDIAETVALIWPTSGSSLSPDEVATGLMTTRRSERPERIAGWLDRMDTAERRALLAILTGGPVLAPRRARLALAEWSGAALWEIEEIWHGQKPPYLDLFAWLNGKGERPGAAGAAIFRPFMLALPLEDPGALNPQEFAAEWKWDGVRVQIVADGGEVGLFSRSGDDIGRAFPDIVGAGDFQAVVDGELLIAERISAAGERIPAAFDRLQRRLGRRTASRSLMRESPAFVRVYDILFDRGEDLRTLPFDRRRRRLENWFSDRRPRNMDISPLLPFADWDDLRSLRSRSAGREGIMLKRRGSVYAAGRPEGHWFKWKSDALVFDFVLMYVERGRICTFGAWRNGELLPVGKAGYGGDERLDRWVQTHTTGRFGPVRAVETGLVLEIGVEGLHRSRRRKSGIAMRCPCLRRIRWEKPAEEADSVETLLGLVRE